MMWFTYILCITGLLLLVSEVELKRSRHHHEKTLSQKVEDNFGEGQRFMKEQINSKHSNRGWKHGKRKSKKHAKDSSSRSSSSSDEVGRTVSGSEQRFKDFVKSHKCEDSPVYRKFLQYYKTATANLQKKHRGNKYETSWLQELANNSSTCPNSCTSDVNNASTTKVQKNKNKQKKQEPSEVATTELPEV